MQYRYITIFRVLGTSLPPGKDEITLLEDSAKGEKIILTSNIDQHSLATDRGLAIGFMVLKGLVGEGGEGSFEDKLDEEIKLLVEQRREQYGTGPFLLFNFSGETSVDFSRPSRDVDDFVIAFDLVDKEQIKTQYQRRINQILTSLFLVTERDYEVKNVTGGIYLLRDGKIYYSLTFTSAAKVLVSRPLQDSSIEQLLEYSKTVSKTIKFDGVYRLLIQATTEDIDKLRAFLFAWTALEIFVNKTFKKYEHQFFEGHTVDELSTLARKFFDRVKEVMKDKYRLRDKFIIVSSLLSENADLDLEEFIFVKKVRDKLLHGEEIDEDTLPTEKAVSLLKKYLRLHLEATKT